MSAFPLSSFHFSLLLGLLSAVFTTSLTSPTISFTSTSAINRHVLGNHERRTLFTRSLTSPTISFTSINVSAINRHELGNHRRRTSLFMSTSNEDQRTTNPSAHKDKKVKKPPASITFTDIRLCRKLKQNRRKMRTRRPSTFWADIHNIESELRTFWSSVNVPIDPNLPPTIPNEALLNHFERHDLRYAIANMGGRQSVSERLGGAKLISGKWNEACAASKEVQCLLQPNNPAGAGLTRKNPPIAPHVKRVLAKVVRKKLEAKNDGKHKHEGKGGGGGIVENDHVESQTDAQSRSTHGDAPLDDYCDDHDHAIHILRYQAGERWAHRSDRNPRGYWDEDVIVKELYGYLITVKEEEGRPSVWMPRQSELANAGLDGLKQAITRYGGNDYICQLARLVPYKKWRYFESILELFVELQLYLVMHEDGREDVFPKLSDIANNGHDRLYYLIMEYGGRKMVAMKLDMDFQTHTKSELMRGMTFGTFSLDFAIHLLHFMRKEMLDQGPPLDHPKIQMPTVMELVRKGETELAKDVMKYGGHEGIARRLDLSFDVNEAKRDALSKARKDLSGKSIDAAIEDIVKRNERRIGSDNPPGTLK